MKNIIFPASGSDISDHKLLIINKITIKTGEIIIYQAPDGTTNFAALSPRNSLSAIQSVP
jgi:hypothetical protein